MNYDVSITRVIDKTAEANHTVFTKKQLMAAWLCFALLLRLKFDDEIQQYLSNKTSGLTCVVVDV